MNFSKFCAKRLQEKREKLEMIQPQERFRTSNWKFTEATQAWEEIIAYIKKRLNP